MTGPFTRRALFRPHAVVRAALLGALTACLALAMAGPAGVTASAAGTDALPLSGATTSGLHNSYDPGAFTYLVL
ncbi:hypothetical protein GTY20_00820 [Streptomyces sp. SID4946]|uniref:hypothetical protein n=1 Tax=Streptomyces sp. LamerLS-31b TaxID=1839765 RepID=UPI00081E87EB|nr:MULTISPECIES: hypothetical protein [unclassified Streptomyces]MYQ89992.1 hypothetical protein [Streptomyces sp. SID4946]SCF57899.1 hypothetical protein GA0115256_10154 [Streptomyces sp. DconLS]SCF75387.1 hypothetical protein GA0115258_11155 [Streptomyces sp. LamerLS-31b]